MKSFTLYAVGDLALDPELTRNGQQVYCRFCLLGVDFADGDSASDGPTLNTKMWLKATGELAESLVKIARKGDQMFVLAHAYPEKWTDQRGAVHHDYTFIVESLRMGAAGMATMEELALGVRLPRDRES